MLNKEQMILREIKENDFWIGAWNNQKCSELTITLHTKFLKERNKELKSKLKGYGKD